MRVSHRRRLASSSYEGAVRHELEQQPLAVYDHCADACEVARKVAISQREDAAEAFYVMDVWRVEQRVRQWRQLLPHVLPFYAIKCNSDPVLLELLANFHHINFHASSVADLEVALQFVPPSRVHFHSPLLTRKTLRLLCSLPPLHSLVVDSEEMLQRVSVMSPSQPLLLRVSLDPLSPRADCAIGVPIDEAYDIIVNASQLGLKLVGISLQLVGGEGGNEEARLEENLGEVSRLLASLRSSNAALSLVDIGGGFHAEKCHRRRVQRLVSIVEGELKGGGGEWEGVEVIATPGSFFAAAAFSLCTSITGKAAIDAEAITRDKVNSGETGYIYQTSEGVYGAFGGQLLSKECASCLPLFSVSARLHASAVLGAALDPMDVPVRRTRLPSLSVGDWLLWRGMGAYSLNEGDDALPVYYFTARKHWQRLQRRCRRRSAQVNSDGSSDEEDDDLAECFGRVFIHS